MTPREEALSAARAAARDGAHAARARLGEATATLTAARNAADAAETAYEDAAARVRNFEAAARFLGAGDLFVRLVWSTADVKWYRVKTNGRKRATLEGGVVTIADTDRGRYFARMVHPDDRDALRVFGENGALRALGAPREAP